MKLVSYGARGSERAGFVDGERIHDLELAMRTAGLRSPVREMLALLDQEDWRASLQQAWEHRHAAPSVALGAVRLGAPIPLPRKLFLAGANTHSHVAEAFSFVGGTEHSREPVIIGKATSSVCGPNDPIELPPESRMLDYEVELGVVIGKRARRIAEGQVREHVAGFCVINDASLRDVQMAAHETNPVFRSHFMGKSYDTLCPMGPWLVTADEFEWGSPFTLTTRVNGQVRQSSDTRELVFGIERLVSYISQAMTLLPGDVLATGSPAGVAFFMKPQQFLQPGDVVRCEVGGLGATENTVMAEGAQR